MNGYLEQEIIARASHADLALYFLLRGGGYVSAISLALATGHTKELFRVALNWELKHGNLIRRPEAELKGTGPKDYNSVEYQLTNQGVAAAFYALKRRNPALHVMLLEQQGWPDHPCRIEASTKEGNTHRCPKKCV
ncbi:hypothetical protein JOF56_003716 [Kibdelosporangium banguiense]|uniref:Uncharacterized protein n=1 Tax=Kibdelosporangium banguiense TaxID=1365924 RepID=A0ABS4TG67_9PSEU|nr:hypothetical protein [Kibdelosporangium banguiense]MBP2323331.1 hypothetical protein [Kibdelosporangium banguiense]